MTTQIIHFTQWVRDNPQRKYNSLLGMLFDPDGLNESFERQAANKAPGVDGMRKADYGGYGLPERLKDLSARVRRLGYRPKPVRRVFIPKSNGGRRALGIPSFEDRIVQDRTSLILQAIWEPEFRDCSYGFRPGRNAHQALKRLAEIITIERTQWIVEADIKGFFDNVSHDHLRRFLAHRISDPRLLRIIDRFLKAGVLEDGVFKASEQGTPQGGLVSPVLANIYLHYVLDMWFEKRYAKTCHGTARLVRYADDFVACFQWEDDAKRFLQELKIRLAQFDLEAEPSKTAIYRFGHLAQARCKQDGHRRPPTFNFLGFTHYVGRSRKGNFVVSHKTQRERIQKKLIELNVRLASLRVQGGKAMMEYAYRHLQGHIQYFGVSGNSRSLRQYRYQVQRLLFKWLNRRSQRRSFTWQQVGEAINHYLPRTCIVRNLYPSPWWMTQAGSRMV
ncbi:group II intron reverse transcriptase/maturase [Methylovulum psychrotolerans]|uniref:Group II intron reverse transcriptase/maturase n=1 Tax=Methylovulum psychrotolerans TaxID=1704499 RepID=A0A1Z4C463_9GAMM|nr:group II intron reverse transcriptase/maturase [Methylovulum psychrotolerans]ASF48347.1 group II intron reverse transcriptase/maturase [Methylovulum psychrotolerans]